MLKRTPLYPFLLAIYPVVALGAHNISQIATSDIWRPMAVSLLVTGAILSLTYLLLRDWHRAAIITGILLLLFFSYGQVYTELKGIVIAGAYPFRHRVLGVLWGVLLVGGVIWVWRGLKRPAVWTPWLNLISALLLIYPAYVLTSAAVGRELGSVRKEKPVSAAAGIPDTPDIYYIILDGFGRQDVLYDEYRYDDRAFLDALRARGFYVAECSQSNYAQTELSLSSSLNMNYLDELGTNYDSLIRYSALRSFLEARGYQTAAFATGFHWTEIDDAKYYMRPLYKEGGLTEFENLLLGTTIVRIYRDRIASETSSPQRYRDRTLSALENMKDLPKKPGPIFAFVHIVNPHYPYVFDKNGQPVYFDEDRMTPAMEVQGYSGQVAFVSGQILDVVDTLLTKSSTPPIIIIQGDHGPRRASHTERMRILNAYYMPRAQNELYPGISPVNSFRLLLNTYFDQSYPLLEDRSYYSSYAKRTDFEPVPNSCPETQ